ncbi:unnamed protein product [Miscanthus lutarioriparius]|uniref:Uncharacterized protein n=1 Tax=Miscanthus lutarioriparius TaxID=422564 RepID=A0A811R7X7_9POAL|nr:unnamed protein product [Miscanthus lutarioriparius]
MENAPTDDTSRPNAGEHGHDCKGGSGRTAAQDSVQSASAVTEVGRSGNAPAEKTRRPSGGDLDDGHGDDGWLTVLERKAVDDYYDPVEAETMAASGDVPSSPLRLAAARFGWLLVGFLAGAAAAVLFLMHQESPTTCTVTVPT